MGISRNQLEKMKQRLAGRAPGPGVEAEAGGAHGHGFLRDGAILLGIDPSLRGTGFGMIRVRRGNVEALDYGVIACPRNWSRSRCLGEIQKQMTMIVARQRPDCCVFEGLFFAQNLKTALIMGEARGASLAVAGACDVPSYEIAPRKVKQAIVGFGAAQKQAVALMVQRMLKLEAPLGSDASDALALALAFAHSYRGFVAERPPAI